MKEVNEMDINLFARKTIHKNTSQRFIEIDVLRGLAIFLMVFGHVLWDLYYFGFLPLNSSVYAALQSFVPQLFFVLVGVGLIVSKKKMENKTIEEENKYYKKLFVRGFRIFSIGMIFTTVSLLYMPEMPVFFGVLHCIGLSIVLSIPFLKYRNYALCFSLLLLFAGVVFAQNTIENPTLLHLILGIHQENVWAYTVDYFPLVPWFGITLLGIAVGDWLYCGDKRRFRMPDLSRYKPVKLFQWAGQHSLAIYILHQPIIAGALTLFMLI